MLRINYLFKPGLLVKLILVNKIMKMHEVKELTKDEIELRLQDSVEALYNLRFQHAVHQLDNPIRVKDVRRDIARLKTVLHEFRLGIRESKGGQQETKE